MQLNEYLGRERLSLRVFGAKVNVSAPTVSRWLHGKKPKLDQIEAIHRATHGVVTIGDFLAADLMPPPAEPATAPAQIAA